MSLTLFAALSSAQISEPRAPVQCPDIALAATPARSARLSVNEVDGWNGPLLQIHLGATSEEVAALGKIAFLRFGGQIFAGGHLGRTLTEDGMMLFVLPFDGEALAPLAAGGKLELVEQDGPGLSLTLAPVAAESMAACIAAHALPRVPYPPRRNSFVATKPDQPLQIRFRGYVHSYYPAKALQEEREGVSRVAMTIGTDGRIAACQVTISSGHADLDAASCRAARTVVYFPATNAAGEPIEKQVVQNLDWKIAK